MFKNWAAIHGVWDRSKPAVAKYVKPIDRAAKQKTSMRYAAAPIGLLKAPDLFDGGRVTTDIKMTSGESTSGVFIGYKDESTPYYAIQIGAYGYQFCISRYEPNNAWYAIKGYGSMENFDSSEPVKVDIEVVGQQVIVAFDGNRIFTETIVEPLEGRGVGLFVWGKDEVQFSQTRVETRKPRVFVIMPFNGEFDPLFSDVIEPVCDMLELDVLRIDQITRPGVIAEDIHQEIARADGVIAEISTGNPNVFYELGIAHTLNKPTVLLFRRTLDSVIPPFDVRHYRAIFYDDTIGGKKRVEEAIKGALHSIANIDIADII